MSGADRPSPPRLRVVHPAASVPPPEVRAAGLTDAHVAGATLACLREITPTRLRALLAEWPDPREALAAVRAGEAEAALLRVRMRPGLADALARRWRMCEPEPMAALLARRRTRVWLATDPDYPIRDEIPDRPPVLFGEGERLDALDAPRIAIVGTRTASPSGLADAHTLGAAYARAGATVVSGLALGIDGAAHRGALGTGRTVAVVATGLDIVYPRRHLALTREIRAQGLVVSEVGFGIGPHAGRFPVRNRIIAGLADAAVVVEATLTGGARITAERAAEYGRPVFALPGARRNPAALGTNALIADGAHPLLAPSDVWIAWGAPVPPGLDDGWSAERPAPSPAPGVTAPLDPAASAVLAAFGGEAASLDQLVARTGRPIPALATALRSLTEAGRLVERRGQWWPV